MTEPISDQMLRAWADRRQLVYRASPGRLELGFAPTPDTGVRVAAFITVNDGVLSVLTSTDRSFPDDEADRLLRLVNEYHHDHRWPMIVLHDSGGRCHLTGEYHLPAVDGLPQAQVAEVIDAAMTSTWDFWRWLHRRLGEADDIRFTPEDWESLDELLSGE